MRDFERPVPTAEEGTLVTVADFHTRVLSGVYTPEEYNAYYAVEDGVSSLEAAWSNFRKQELKFVPEIVTHVALYRK